MAYARMEASKPTGQWLGKVDHRKKGGRLFKRSFPTKKEAEAYEAYVHVYGREPETLVDGISVAPKGRSFREIAERCKADGGPNHRWGPQDKRTFDRLAWCVSKLGDYDVADINRALVRQRVVEDLAARPGRGGRKMSQSTINKYLAVISGVLHWAVDEEVIDSKSKMPFKEETPRKRPALTWADEDALARFFVNMQPFWIAIDWLLWTGMRPSELQRLRPEQIKDEPLPHVVLDASQTKTKEGRLLYVDPGRARSMRALIANGALPDSRKLATWFKIAVEHGCAESSATLYSTRHTFATRLAEAGVPREFRKEMLGHSRGDTHDGYVHGKLETQRKAIEAVCASRVRGADIVPFGNYDAKRQPPDNAEVA